MQFGIDKEYIETEVNNIFRKISDFFENIGEKLSNSFYAIEVDPPLHWSDQLVNIAENISAEIYPGPKVRFRKIRNVPFPKWDRNWRGYYHYTPSREFREWVLEDGASYMTPPWREIRGFSVQYKDGTWEVVFRGREGGDYSTWLFTLVNMWKGRKELPSPDAINKEADYLASLPEPQKINKVVRA